SLSLSRLRPVVAPDAAFAPEVPAAGIMDIPPFRESSHAYCASGGKFYAVRFGPFTPQSERKRRSGRRMRRIVSPRTAPPGTRSGMTGRKPALFTHPEAG